jgi:hypothetical protein
MRIDKRLILIGAMIIVLSMTLATQYATTRITYSFTIVHPSDSDIRYIGSDNSSADALRVLRVTDNSSNDKYATIELGSWMPDSEINYTAAFGIVNEEQFPVNITYINISGDNTSFFTIWLHNDRDADYTGDTANQQVKVWDGSNGAVYNANSVVWTLGAGNGDSSDCDAGDTNWDDTSGVRFSLSDTDATNETSDFVWVGISLDIPSGEWTAASASTGTIYIHFKSTTDN